MHSRSRASACLAIAALLSAGLTSAARAAEADKACDPIENRVATTPIPPQKASALKDYLDLESRMPDRADVVLVGDSLVRQWSDESARIAFPDKKIVNFGVGGDRTQNVLWRLRESRIKALSPQTVVLFAGHNNMADWAEPCAIATGVLVIAQALHDTWPNAQLIVMGIPPYGVGYTSREQDRIDVNKMIARGVAPVSWAKWFPVDRELTSGIQYNPRERFLSQLKFYPFYEHSPYYAADNVHISDAGYDLIGRRLNEALR